MATAPKKKPVKKAPKKEAPAERAGTWIHEFCTKADLSKLLHLSMRALADQDAKGVLVRGEKKGTYRTIASVQAYVDGLRQIASGRAKETASPLAAEKQQIAQIERETAAIKLAQLKGEVLLLSEVDESWSLLAGVMKSKVLTIPTRARGRLPHLTAHDAETIKDVVKDILREIADEIQASVIGAEANDVRP